MAHPIQQYKERLNDYQEKLTLAKNAINQIAIARVVVFAGGILLGYFLFDSGWIIFSMGIIATLVAFVFLMKAHSKRYDEKQHLSYLVKTNENEIAYHENNFTPFDPGKTFIDPDHPYSADLDIFGEGSFFHRINRTVTIEGRHCLANWINQISSKKTIEARQQANQEIAEIFELRQEFIATGLQNKEGESDVEFIINWLDSPTLFIQNNSFKIITIALPILLGLGIAGTFFGLPTSAPTVIFLLNLGIIGKYLKKINYQHDATSRHQKLLMKYGKLIHLIEEQEFKSPYLVEQQKAFSSESKKAGDQLNHLAKLINQWDGRLNIFGALILNGFLLWDIRYTLLVEKWKLEHKDAFPKWVALLAEYDAFISTGNYYFNHPEKKLPIIVEDGNILEASEIAHPLLPSGESVTNSVQFDKPGRFLIITGSNMAGKSTFLRAIGLNYVLALSGLKVSAEKFTCRVIPLHTSMRISDSILNRESTFYAELKRIKQIIQAVEKEPVFIILDEILKGTNSSDKLKGSIVLVKQLMESKSTGIIATHDLALGELEQEHPEYIKNYCFEVQTEGEKFVFDYKLKEGVCKVRNATQLMREMGLSMDKAVKQV